METKVKLRVAFFAYGGNSGFPSVVCSHIPFLVELTRLLDSHPCIGPGNWEPMTYSDTPVTMTRNRAAREALRDGYDFLFMLDSDNVVDLYKKLEGLQGFLKNALDFAIPRLQRGLPTVIAAPYCGQPPDPVSGGHENIFAFHWDLKEHDRPGGMFSLEQYSVQHAAMMKGIQPAAAAATGVILYSTNAFTLLEAPYFKYEYTDQWQTHKGSTEDVQNTRDISMASWAKYGENCLFIDWDNWAGHVKPKIVGKPHPTNVDTIAPSFVKVVLEGRKSGEWLHHADFETPKPAPQFDPTLPASRVVQPRAEVEQRFGLPEGSLKEQPDLPPGAIGFINGRPIWKDRDACRKYALEAYARQGNQEPAYDGLADQLEQEPVNKPADYEPAKPPVGIEEVAGRPIKWLGFKSTDNDMRALSRLVELTERRAKRPIRCLEVGSWVGASAVAIASGFHEDGSCVYSVDTWQGSPNDQTSSWVLQGAEPERLFDENTKDLQDAQIIRKLKGESSAIAATLPNQDLDLILIDSGHTYGEVSRDAECWFRHLDPKGVLVFHDYGDPGHPGVQKFVDETYGDAANAIPGTKLAFVIKSDWEQRREPEPVPTEVREVRADSPDGGLPSRAYQEPVGV